MDSLKYLPFSYCSKYPNILDEMFKTKKYKQFFGLAAYILSEDSVYFEKKYYWNKSNSINEEKKKLFCIPYLIPFTNKTYDFAGFFLKTVSYYEDYGSLNRSF